MKHLQNFWEDELRMMRKALRENYGFTVSEHFINERMSIRGISLMEIAEVILSGEILEGYDVGQYPNYRNPDPLRTIVGITSKGRTISIGLAIRGNHNFCVTTAYEGITNRLYLDSAELYFFEKNSVC